MNMPGIRIWELADLLEKDGQTSFTPKNEKLGIKIYEDPKSEGDATILIPGVIQRPSIGINNPEDFFKELQKEIESRRHKIKKLIFQEGGTIPLIDWFRDWCRDNVIEITWVDSEIRNLDTKLEISPEARETFNDIIDEL